MTLGGLSTHRPPPLSDGIRYGVVLKFKQPSLERKIVEGDLESTAIALQGVRLNTVYLIWRIRDLRTISTLSLQSELLSCNDIIR